MKTELHNRSLRSDKNNLVQYTEIWSSKILIMRLSTLWIPRSKIIGSNWELISRFRCLLASWIPRFDFLKVIWEVQYCKCFKIQVPHSLWFLKWHKNYLSGNCFSLRCKYFVKRFPVCCFILKNGNSWMNAQLISSKKSKSRSFFSWSGNSWFLGYLTIKSNRRPLTDLCRSWS